jgi:O-succinylbenzoic acid--CoA ligase
MRRNRGVVGEHDASADAKRDDRPSCPRYAALLGGGPVPQELVEKGLRLDIPIAQTYGLTETASQATTLRLSEAMSRAGSAGKPLLPVEIRIEREDGSVCAPDEAGEIVVRGATVSPGYWQRPEATTEGCEAAARRRAGYRCRRVSASSTGATT